MSLAHSRLVIAGGTVIDPETRLEQHTNVLLEGGRIVGLAREVPSDWDAAPEIDAAGAWVLPGLICLRTHVGEPGFEWREDVASASFAGAAGGFTTLCATPDTDPVNDVRAVTEQIMTRSAAALGARVVPVGAATKGLKGQHLAEMGDLQDAGCVAVSTGETSVVDGQLMRRILEYARSIDTRVFSSPGEPSMTRGGLMNEGLMSLRLGLPGIPAESEAVSILRDGLLAKLAGTPLHFQRVSTAAGLRALEFVRGEGAQVTADCTPHHLWFSEAAVTGFDTTTKVTPPLRSPADVEALRDGVRRGLITAIATDHSPRSQLEKWVEYNEASAGTTGLESALAAILELVRQKAFPLMDALARLTVGPAAVLGD